MFKRIARLGTVPTKYQFAIVLNSLQLGVDFSGSVGAVWTRGPHKVKSIIVDGDSGSFTWDKDQQTQQPMMLVCTLYMEKDKDKKKEKEKKGDAPAHEGPIFNSKSSRITVKQVNGASTKTIGEISIDLASYATAKGGQWELNLPLEKCTDKKARLSFTLHSRPSAVSGGAADFDTMSTMEGMDQSFVDNDSIADFTAFNEVQRESISASERVRAVRESGKETSVSHSKPSAKQEDSDDEDIPPVDDILNQFKKNTRTDPPAGPSDSTPSSTSFASVTKPEEKKTPMRFDSSDDDDDELENPTNMFSKKPSPSAASTAATASTTATSFDKKPTPAPPSDKKPSPAPPSDKKPSPAPPSGAPMTKPVTQNSSSDQKPMPSTASPVRPTLSSSVSSSSTTSPMGLSDRDTEAEVARRTADYKERLSAAAEDNASLRKELDQAENRIWNLEQERKTQDGIDVHRDCYSHDDMKSAISQGIAPLAAKMKKIEAALKAADARNSEMQIELRKESARAQQLENELSAHDESTRAMLDDREARAQTRIAELESQVSALESRIDAERVESKTRSDALERVLNDRHERSMSLKDAELRQLHQEVESIKRKDFRFDQMSKAKYGKEEEKLRARVAFYEEQVLEAEMLISSLRDTYVASNQVLMNEVNTLERKVIDSHSALADASQESKELTKHIKMLEEQMRKSVENRSKLNEVVNELTVQLSEKSELLGRVMNDKEELMLTIDRLNKQIQRYNKY